MTKFNVLLASVLCLTLSSCIVEPETQLVLSSMQINRIAVLDFSNTDEGKGWDFWTSHPDVYVSVSSNEQYLYISEHYDECVNSNTYNYDKGLPVYLENYTSSFSIELWDFDSTSSDEYMDECTFVPENLEGKDEIELLSTTGNTRIKLFVEWNYKEV